MTAPSEQTGRREGSPEVDATESSSRMPQLLGRGHTVKAETGNQYVVTRRLGEGQFAEVWEVKQSTGGDLRVRLGCDQCALQLQCGHDKAVVCLSAPRVPCSELMRGTGKPRQANVLRCW